MDNNNVPNVAHNDDSHSVVVNPVIDITQGSSAAVMDSNRQPPMTPEAQQELVDMLMTVEENDDMPSLAEVSSTESDIENIVIDSNLGAQDMQTPILQHVLSGSSSQSTIFSASPSPLSSDSLPQPQRNNRRARVEDDDDEDRDRRHPSQRVGSNGQPSISNAPPNQFFGPFFTSFRDAGAALGLGLGAGFFNRTPNPNPSENSTTPNMHSNESTTNPTPGAATSSSQLQHQGPPPNANGATNRRAPMHFVDYEFSIVMDGSRRPQPVQRAQQQAPLNDPNVQGQPGGNPPTGTPSGPTFAGPTGLPPNIFFNPPVPLDNLSTFLGIPIPIFGVPEEKEDPMRARKLVDGLEEISVGLVRRLERVGTGGGGMGEDESKGGDVGCAVCWDRLLYEGVEQEGTTGNQGGSECMPLDRVPGESPKEFEPKYPKVVSLPCAHVFHAECLIPWFSRPRHTTCPTCRFNIDPDNLTYVSPRQRREQQRAANNDNNNDFNQPSEDAPEEGPVDPASATRDAARTDGELPPQQQGGNPLGGGFAGIIQMLNAQGQPQQQQPAAAGAHDNAVPSGAQGPPPLFMSIPMPVGGAGNFFPAGFAAGQLPMPMPMPFMTVPHPPGNAEAVPMPMPMPWRMMADPLHARGNRMNAAASGGAAGADHANATPAATVPGPSSSNNVPNPHQAQLPHRPTLVADVIRISVDMVFDGRSRRENQGPPNNSATQPGSGNLNPHDANYGQATGVDTGNEHYDDEPPELISLEDADEENRQFTEFFNRMSNSASDGRDAPTTANNNPELPAPHTQAPPPPPRPQPPVYSMEDIHVAGTGRSFGEAFTQALSRLQTRMAQPRQEAQNPQTTGAAAADEGPPPPPPPPQQQQQQQAQAEAQGQNQPPWQFMAMPFMEFGIPMRAAQPEVPKQPWTLPPPPGPTLRQRIERREWEAGLRCHDVSCGLGPSDEDPLGDDINETLRKGQQLSIMSNEGDGGMMKAVCEHRFHKTCLVSAERVALRGAEVIPNEAGGVDVSCPVCRGIGRVTQEQWDEGVRALQ